MNDCFQCKMVNAVLLATFCVLAANSAGRAADADLCASGGSPARVAAVLDDLELALDDGRVLRLAGIDPARGTPSRPRLGEDARAGLERWLVGRSVQVRPLSAVVDRWDRVPSLVYASVQATDGTGETDPKRSVGEALLDAGWARARPDPEIHACFPAFLNAEAKARASALGLWADPYYAVVDADDRRGLAERTGTMVLIEGQIRLRSSPRRILVTLGRAYRAVVVRPAPRLAKAPVEGGLDLQRFGEAQVRIRGFLDDRFGFRVDLVSGDQIEMLGPATPVLPVAPGRPPAQGD